MPDVGTRNIYGLFTQLVDFALLIAITKELNKHYCCYT